MKTISRIFPMREKNQKTKGGAYGAALTRKRTNAETNAHGSGLTTKQVNSSRRGVEPAPGFLKITIALPDIEFCQRQGWVKFVPQPELTDAGTPRVYRTRGMSSTEYTRYYRARYYAQGLTARGTPRKERGLSQSAAGGTMEAARTSKVSLAGDALRVATTRAPQQSASSIEHPASPQ